jgi:recombination protein RecT
MTTEIEKQAGISVVLKQSSVQQRISEVLGERASQFSSSIISLVNANAQLKAADPRSIVAAAMIAATLDLPVNKDLGFAHIIPYSGVAQFQIGYKGLIQLAMRSGQYKHLNACEVCEGELIGSNKLTGEVNIDPAKKTSDTIIGYAAYMELLNGFRHSIYWTIDDVNKHAKRFSQAVKNNRKDSPWFTSFEVMAKKTLIKSLLSKWGPLSVAMQKAITEDQSVHRDIDAEGEYIDNATGKPEAESKPGASGLAEKLKGKKKEDNTTPTPAPQDPAALLKEVMELWDKSKASKCEAAYKLAGLVQSESGDYILNTATVDQLTIIKTELTK